MKRLKWMIKNGGDYFHEWAKKLQFFI
jgi:hypothetical protein